MYLNDVRERGEADEAKMLELYTAVLQGDQSVVNAIVDGWLMRVIHMAGMYDDVPVNMEDLIQEGNLSLLLAVEELCGNSEVLDVKKELDRYVKSRMIELADEQMASKGMENTIVAKTNLIHEATKVLAEEWGRLATLEELADYTKMPEEEISMYVDLALDEIHIGRE